jgi:1-acyl-sn-glycerol-3-phosphate acyltransferase
MSSGSVGATLFAVYKTLAISVPTFAEAMVGRLTIARSDARLADWSRAIVRHADIDLTVEGLSHVPRDRACVYMSNHQSHFDIPLLFSIFPGTLRMVAKAELFKVPIWGRAMKEAGFVRVTRSGDRAEAMAAMRECAEALGRGINVWLAPEGTRSLDGRLGKFKKGGFILARDTGADIVPLAIDGSRAVLPKKTTVIQRGKRVRVAFGPPISPAGREVNAVMAEVRAFIAAHVTEPAV